MAFLSAYNSFIFHNYIENQYCYNEEDNQEIKGMRALWRAVITQALMDAASESKKPFCLVERMKARVWLRGKTDDFLEVCHLADMDPEYVRNQAKLAIGRNCKWRNDMKK